MSDRIATQCAQATPTSAELSFLLVDVRERKDKPAFKILFEYFAPRVKSYVLKLGSDETMAEEIAQQTLVQVWRKAHLFDESKAQASTWIFRIARNLRLDLLRKEKHFDGSEYDFNQIEDERDDQETCLNRMENAEIVQDALRTLTPEQLEIVHLSFYEGLSHAQIAEETGLALGTVKSRMRLACNRIRDLVGDTR